MKRGTTGIDAVGPPARLYRSQTMLRGACAHGHGVGRNYLHGYDWTVVCPDCCCHRAPAPMDEAPPLAVVAGAPRGAPALRRASATPRRVLLYSHDTFGLGHLRRNLAIARSLLSAPEPFEVMLLTGSPMQSDWPLPEALTVRALPPVVKVGEERYGPRDHRKNFALLKGHRQALILKAALAFRPDVFLVDHAPIGMGGELLPVLGLLHEDYPETRLVLGMRDILDAPEATCSSWREQGVPDILDRVYDQILVYGRRDWFDVVEAYEIPQRIAGKVRYCGYVCNDPGPEAALPPLPPSEAGKPTVLVTVGGGGDGRAVIQGYLRALRDAGDFGCRSLIVPGPLMDRAERSQLEREAAACPDVHLIDGATDMLPLMECCDLVIAMAGYNTSAELLSLGRRAILVPRARPRAEQRLRAELLARLGFADKVDPDGDIAAQLSVLVPRALRAGREPAVRLPLDGAQRVAAALAALSRRREARLEA